MDNFIKNLEIKNFKSIKHLTLDCKRVNVFIGKPNVGKSNILEALGLLGWRDYILDLEDLEESHFFAKTIRHEEMSDLFYDGITQDYNEFISIQTNIGNTFIRKESIRVNDCFSFYYGDSQNQFTYDTWLENQTEGMWMEMNAEGRILNNDYVGNILTNDKINKYDFIEGENYHLNKRILGWSGQNFYTILLHSKELRKRIVEALKELNLEFVIDKKQEKFIIQKSQDGFVYQYPYSSIADTFQRFIFYLAAIESNKDAVLIFEEPEVHSFPPYVKELAERIAYKKENQFFISTHSPYLLNTLISRLDSSELTIFLTYYKDYQTFVKPLSEESIQEVRDLGVDVFSNLDRF